MNVPVEEVLTKLVPAVAGRLVGQALFRQTGHKAYGRRLVVKPNNDWRGNPEIGEKDKIECYRRVWNVHSSREKRKVKRTSEVKAYPYLNTDVD